jgi:nitroreductase
VPREVILSIVNMAKRSASWCNVQPWQLVITSEERTGGFRDALQEHAKSHPEIDADIAFPPGYDGIYGQRRRESGLALYKALGINRDDHERRASQSAENFRFFGAPHVAILSIPCELGVYAAVDAGGFVASFLLSAHAHGVATTPQAALARYAGFVRQYLDIPDGQHMVCGISFGYAETAHPVNQFRTSRASLDELVRFI